jgi:hypothetical protein
MSDERYTILEDYHGDVKYIREDKSRATTQLLEKPTPKKVSLVKPTDSTIKPIINLNILPKNTTVHADKPVCLTKPEDILQPQSTPTPIQNTQPTVQTTATVNTKIRVSTSLAGKMFTLKGMVMVFVFIVMAMQLPILDMLSLMVAMLLFNAMPFILIYMAFSTYKSFKDKKNQLITEEEFKSKLKEKGAFLTLVISFIVVAVLA